MDNDEKDINNINRTVSEKELKLRIKWIIKLRWIAITGVFIVIFGTSSFLKLILPFLYLYMGNFIMVIYNIIFIFYNKQLMNQKITAKWYTRANRFANIKFHWI